MFQRALANHMNCAKMFSLQDNEQLLTQGENICRIWVYQEWNTGSCQLRFVGIHNLKKYILGNNLKIELFPDHCYQKIINFL